MTINRAHIIYGNRTYDISADSADSILAKLEEVGPGGSSVIAIDNEQGGKDTLFWTPGAPIIVETWFDPSA
jgi:hypothetical protein